jgi:glutamyl-tRNA reductase
VVRENEGKWESASARDLERVGMVAKAVVSRVLHDPTLRMKEFGDDRVHMRMALVRELFGLNDEEAVASDEPAGRETPLADVRQLRP